MFKFNIAIVWSYLTSTFVRMDYKKTIWFCKSCVHVLKSHGVPSILWVLVLIAFSLCMLCCENFLKPIFFLGIRVDIRGKGLCRMAHHFITLRTNYNDLRHEYSILFPKVVSFGVCTLIDLVDQKNEINLYILVPV